MKYESDVSNAIVNQRCTAKPDQALLQIKAFSKWYIIPTSYIIHSIPLNPRPVSSSITSSYMVSSSIFAMPSGIVQSSYVRPARSRIFFATSTWVASFVAAARIADSSRMPRSAAIVAYRARSVIFLVADDVFPRWIRAARLIRSMRPSYCLLEVAYIKHIAIG